MINDKQILAIINEQSINTDKEILKFLTRIAEHLQNYQNSLPNTIPVAEDSEEIANNAQNVVNFNDEQ